MWLGLTGLPPIDPGGIPGLLCQGLSVDPRRGGRRGGEADRLAVLLQQIDQLTDSQYGRCGADDKGENPTSGHSQARAADEAVGWGKSVVRTRNSGAFSQLGRSRACCVQFHES